ncbi:methyltransferase domain-containing protein [Nonomuraea sp. NPDC004702]
MADTTAQRIERLAAYVAGLDYAPTWVVNAFRAVPRHLFIPSVALAATGNDGQTTVIDRDADPGTWWAQVYSPNPIITQLDDGGTDIRTGTGAYTSSSSAPSTVAEFLHLLDPEPGDQVLEIGTGTGWTAALISHVIGEHGKVTSIEVDPVVAEQAAKHLAAAGVQPHLVVGDGTAGCSWGALFDRVHVTCAITTVPYAWVEQARPGGVIVAPFSPGVGDEFALRLVVTPDSGAVGRFPGYASYMPLRAQRGISHVPDDGSGQYQPTRVHPRTIGLAPSGAGLAMSALTGLRSHVSREEERFVVYVLDPEDPGCWAAAVHRYGQLDHLVYQVGDRPLWDEMTDAYFRWVSWGEPDRSRFGLTVDPEGQYIWLDSPDNVIG